MMNPKAASLRARARFLAVLAPALVFAACASAVPAASGNLVAVTDAFASAAAGSGKKAPRIAVDERNFSFGRVPNDRGVEHVFTVSNTGDAPLVISRVQTSCGCTAAMMESSVIKAGESGRLRVSFNPRNMHQVVTRGVTIWSNDPVEPTVVLNVSAGEEKIPPKEPVWTHKKKDRLTFGGECADCHVPRSASVTGPKLYAAACAACHGPSGEGVMIGKEHIGPPLKRDRMSVRTAAGIGQVVEAGTGNPWMPGFGKAYGGPLTEKQVASLVELIFRSFEKKK